jgi:hypothetical protein
MPKFEKTIVREGKFRQWNENTKQYEMVEVTPERLEKLRGNFQKQLSLGMKIPAPWKHDFDITVLSTGDNGLLEDSSTNAGFWEDLVIKTLDNGKKGLVGIIDAPGDPNDLTSPAGKIGTSVKDTSIYTRKNLPITSGVDKEEFLDEGIMHIALVTHPIELNQENFKLLDTNDLHLVMSNMVPDVEEPGEQTESEDETENSSSLGQLIEDLKNCCKLFLPADTSVDNIVQNLSIAVGQYKLLHSEDASSPNSDSFKVEPLLMSHLDPSQIKALVDGKVINPKTNKAYVAEDFNTTQTPSNAQDVQTQLIMSAMQNSMQADRRKGYRTRIDSLLATGRTTKTFADSHLYPQADAYNIEFRDGQVVTPNVESLLMNLESMPAPEHQSSVNLIMGSGANDDQASDKEIEDMAKYMASLV